LAWLASIGPPHSLAHSLALCLRRAQAASGSNRAEAGRLRTQAWGYHSRHMGRVQRVSDEEPGIRRVRAGRGFSYRTSRGPVRDRTTLDRIRALAIPPAWTDVWICPSPDGHLQATGRDAKGRQQYRYHANWRAARERQKFSTLAIFGATLPAIRRRRARDLLRGDLSIATVAAGVVLLLEHTMIRVGNE